MASRRMFSLRLINSTRFLKMPISSQLLYFHLGMRADDDGVVEAYPVLKTVGCNEDDLKVLVAKGFAKVLNEDLITYITDWNENNRIRADRKQDSMYKDLLLQIIPNVGQLTDKCQADDGHVTDMCQRNDRIGKDSIGKVSIGQDRLGKDSISALLIDSSLSEPVREKVTDFLAYRKEIKKPYKSERSIKSLITQIEKQEQALGSTAVISVIDTTMQNGWQGLFWDKAPKKQEMSTAEAARYIDNGGTFFEGFG